MITQPASAAAKAISCFPLTPPFAMPGRIAKLIPTIRGSRGA